MILVRRRSIGQQILKAWSDSLLYKILSVSIQISYIEVPWYSLLLENGLFPKWCPYNVTSLFPKDSPCHGLRNLHWTRLGLGCLVPGVSLGWRWYRLSPTSPTPGTQTAEETFCCCTANLAKYNPSSAPAAVAARPAPACCRCGAVIGPRPPPPGCRAVIGWGRRPEEEMLAVAGAEQD